MSIKFFIACVLLILCTSPLSAVRTADLEAAYDADPTLIPQEPFDTEKRIVGYCYLFLCCGSAIGYLISQALQPTFHELDSSKIPCSALCDIQRHNANNSMNRYFYAVPFENDPAKKIIIECDDPHTNFTIETSKLSALFSNIPICGHGVIQDDIDDVMPELLESDE
jgi:hypothetical protein